MNEISELPELQALERPSHIIRLPDQLDVPVSRRVLRLIDSPTFRRLADIRQLGLVALVYPGATHTRFEHSLGVYRNALLFLRHLLADPRFLEVMSVEAAEGLLVSALLHDIGHWPYCHPIEDLELPGMPSHESIAESTIQDGEIADCLDEDWRVSPTEVSGLIAGRPTDGSFRLAASILSGPLDVDKIDYLYRDSLHAGVPYGRNFDVGRLISSLCLNAAGDGIAITNKGRTAAELLVFARYVMFNEVYWHHTVRSATAMLQRAFFELLGTSDYSPWCRLVDRTWESSMMSVAAGTTYQPLVEGLFGAERRLYKRWFQLNSFDHPDLYKRLARRPYNWAVKLARALAQILETTEGIEVSAEDILVDAPPVGLEVQFNVDVWDSRRGQYDPLAELSPVVAALAERQFDEFVKQLRIFVAPQMVERIASRSAIDLLHQALLAVDETK